MAEAENRASMCLLYTFEPVKSSRNFKEVI